MRPAPPFALAALAVALATAASGQSTDGPPTDGLGCLADALGGAERVDRLRHFAMETVTTAPLGGAEATVAGTFTYDGGASRWEVGGRTVRVGPGPAAVSLPSGPAGDAAQALRQSAWLVLPVLLSRRREVGVEGACRDGLLRLSVPAFPEPLVVQLDADARPRLVSTFVRRDGRRVYLAVRYGDYREVEGLWVPLRMSQAVGGAPTGETRARTATVRLADADV